MRRGDMIESAIVLPVMIFLSLAFVNLALAGYASAAAKQAATYAARAAATDPGSAVSAAQRMLRAGIGEYDIRVECPGGCDLPGGDVHVAVRWRVPNLIGGLGRLLGGGDWGKDFTGEAISSARIELWETP